MGAVGRSPEAAQYRKLYNTARWRKRRAHQLAVEPLCRMCAEMGHVTAATVADHIEPHRGDEALFWAADNLQSLCAACHSGPKAAAEMGHARTLIGIDGWPAA